MIPYAWQEPGTTLEIPARKCGRINVLGFMNRKNDFYPFIFEQSVHTEVVIACVDELSKTLKKKTVVVMDNASVHTSEAFEECLPQWKKIRIDHQVLNSIFSGTEPDRNTLAQYQIRLAAFFGISVYKRLERCVGTHPEKLWVKIPNHFCLSAYQQVGRDALAM